MLLTEDECNEKMVQLESDREDRIRRETATALLAGILGRAMPGLEDVNDAIRQADALLASLKLSRSRP